MCRGTNEIFGLIRLKPCYSSVARFDQNNYNDQNQISGFICGEVYEQNNMMDQNPFSVLIIG